MTMILPRRVLTARDRVHTEAALRAFTGFIIVYPGHPAAFPPCTRLSPEQRADILAALQQQTDPQRHIWIASGRDEMPGSFLSLLHATVDQSTGALVDLLLSLLDRNHAQANGYDGFGEFTLLTLLLERMGITHLVVPVPLDAHRAGLTSAGWREHEPGTFVWEKTAQGQSSR